MKFLAVLFLVGTFYSFSPSDVTIFENSKWLPADFDTRKSVLLVQNFHVGTTKAADKACEKFNNELKEYMKTAYPYKYEFVDEKEIESNSKYANKDMYRYVIINANGTHYASGDGMRSSINLYHIYDRKADKHYPESSRTSSFIITIFRPMVNRMVEYLKGLK